MQISQVNSRDQNHPSVTSSRRAPASTNLTKGWTMKQNTLRGTNPPTK